MLNPVSQNAPHFKPMFGELSPHKERIRRRLVKLVFIVYWLLIFEGVLRKWVWPQFSQYLFFIRDPFVLGIYGTALANGMWPRLRPMLLFAYVIALLAAAVIVFQVTTGEGGDLTLLLAGYGWRNYFLYIPLAFLIAEQFRQEDIYKLFKQTMVVMIPIAILSVAQFFSSPNSVINSGIASEESLQFKGFRGALGRVRPNSTFTSVAGQMHLVASAISMVLALWILPAKRRPVAFGLLMLGAAAALTCLAFSISRGMFIHTGLVVLSAIVAGATLKGRGSLRAVLLPTLLVIAAFVLYPLIFPEAFEAFTTRWAEGSKSEGRVFGDLGVFGRALYELYDFTRLVGEVPLFGYGMGAAGNAATTLGLKIGGTIPLLIAETDWARHFVDMGPILALLFIIFRIMLTINLGMQSLQAARRSGNPLSILLFGYVGVVLLYGLITGHGTVGGYGWIFVGLLMASIRVGRFDVQEKVR